MPDTQPQNQNTPTHPALATSGMISSAYPLATQAGLDILTSGGNAFDAAVTVAATLNVVEPMMSGIGGYGTIVLYDAQAGEAWFLDCSGRIPAAVDSDVFRPPAPDYMENRRGAKAVSTPGNLAAWEAMSKKYGTLEWRGLFDAAIGLADRGFTVSERTARFIKSEFPSFPEYAKAIYGYGGQPLRTGERLVQKDLAGSLRLIAEQGARVMYDSELGWRIDAAMRESGGFLSMDDLRQNRAEWWEPISINYRGYEIVTASPPANAFDMLVRLGMMSQFDLAELGHNTAAYLHTFAEVTKHGFWVRLRYACDPDLEAVPLDMLLSEEYWAAQVERIDPQRAKPFEAPKAFSEQAHTTHFVVADRWGNVVSATQTVGGLFGSKVMPRGTGIWLNNSLQYCTFEPKGNPMDAFPGRHKLSGDCPTLIMRDGRPWIAIGAMGGHTIGQTVPQMVMSVIDFDMDTQQAIAAPRISFFEPDVIGVEEGIPSSVREELSVKGHNIHVKDEIGGAHGLTIEYDSNRCPSRFTGGADPRGEGAAIGY